MPPGRWPPSAEIAVTQVGDVPLGIRRPARRPLHDPCRGSAAPCACTFSRSHFNQGAQSHRSSPAATFLRRRAAPTPPSPGSWPVFPPPRLLRPLRRPVDDAAQSPHVRPLLLFRRLLRLRPLQQLPCLACGQQSMRLSGEIPQLLDAMPQHLLRLNVS